MDGPKKLLDGKVASVIVILALLGGAAVILLPGGGKVRQGRFSYDWESEEPAPRAHAGRTARMSGSAEDAGERRVASRARASGRALGAVPGAGRQAAVGEADEVPEPPGSPSLEDEGGEDSSGSGAGPAGTQARLEASRQQGFLRRTAGRIGSALSRATGRSPSQRLPPNGQTGRAPSYGAPSFGAASAAGQSGPWSAGGGGGGGASIEQEPAGTEGPGGSGSDSGGSGSGQTGGPGTPRKAYNIPGCAESDGTRCAALTCVVEMFDPISTKIETGLHRQFEGGRHVMGLAKEDLPKISLDERPLLDRAKRLEESSCADVSKTGRDASRWLDGLLDDLKEQKDLLAQGIWDCHGPKLGRSIDDPCGVSGLKALQRELEFADEIKEASTTGVVREHRCGPSETGEQDCVQDVQECRQFVRDFHSTQKKIHKDGKRPDLDPTWCDRYPYLDDKIGYDPWCHSCRCVLGRVRWSRDKLKDFTKAAMVFAGEIPQVIALLPPLPREINHGQRLLNNTCKDIPPGNRNQSYFQGITELQATSRKLRRVLSIFEQLRARQCGDKARF